jgi:hypothetical protein
MTHTPAKKGAYHQPINWWFWLGIVLALVGGLLALSPLFGWLLGWLPVVLGLIVLMIGGVLAFVRWVRDNLDISLL